MISLLGVPNGIQSGRLRASGALAGPGPEFITNMWDPRTRLEDKCHAPKGMNTRDITTRIVSPTIALGQEGRTQMRQTPNFFQGSQSPARHRVQRIPLNTVTGLAGCSADAILYRNPSLATVATRFYTGTLFRGPSDALEGRTTGSVQKCLQGAIFGGSAR